MIQIDTPPAVAITRLTRLAYELADAHGDTAALAQERPLDDEWRAHLTYLRDLQRVTREELARVAQAA
jgi:hypothetical protein